MQSSLESLGQFERKLSVSIDAARVDGAITKRLQELAKNIKLPGFRPGKVPMKLLQGRYGESVRHEIINETIRETLQEAMTQEAVTPTAPPKVDIEQDKAGEDLKYTAEFEVYPEIKLNDVAGITLDEIVPVVADADTDDVLARIQKAHQVWQKHDGAAENGHQVTMNYTGVLLGETDPFADDKDMKVVIGDKRMIPGFEDELVGLKAGDDKKFTITFPDEYAEHLAGKRAEFSISVVEVEKGELPEITDTFVQETLGMAEGSKEKLLERVREDLEKEGKDKIRRELHKEILDKLAEANPIEVPPSLIDNEFKVLSENKDNPQLSQAPLDSDDKVREEAQKRVSYSLLLGQYIRDHKIEVDQQKVQAAVMNMARGSQDPEAMLRWFYEDKNRVAHVSSMVLEEQALDQLLQEVTRNPIEKPYKDVMAD